MPMTITTPNYSGPERRADPLTHDRVALMIEEAIEERVSKMEDRMVAHIDVKFAQMHRLIADAFPNGDPHGHRMAHEKAIRDAEGWSAIKRELITKVATGGVWVAMGWLLLAAWQAFKEGVKS